MKQSIFRNYVFFSIAFVFIASCKKENTDLRCPGPASGESVVYKEVKTGSCGSSGHSSITAGCDVSLIFSIPSDASNVFATLKMAGDFDSQSYEYATVKLNGTTFDIVRGSHIYH